MGPARPLICIYVHALVATGVVRNARLIAADLALAGHNVQLVTALPGGEGAAGVPHHALLPGVGHSRLREKADAVNYLANFVVLVPDPVESDEHVRRIAMALGADPESVGQVVRSARNSASPGEHPR